jgi:hypothetical protein
MLDFIIELYEPNAAKPFARRTTTAQEWPNIFTVQAILNAYFADVDPNRKVEKILIRSAIE